MTGRKYRRTVLRTNVHNGTHQSFTARDPINSGKNLCSAVDAAPTTAKIASTDGRKYFHLLFDHYCWTGGRRKDDPCLGFRPLMRQSCCLVQGRCAGKRSATFFSISLRSHSGTKTEIRL